MAVRILIWEYDEYQGRANIRNIRDVHDTILSTPCLRTKPCPADWIISPTAVYPAFSSGTTPPKGAPSRRLTSFPPAVPSQLRPRVAGIRAQRQLIGQGRS